MPSNIRCASSRPSLALTPQLRLSSTAAAGMRAQPQDAARMQGRGDLIESPLIRSLRNAHLTPLRFWGVTAALPPWCQWMCTQAGLIHQFDRDRGPAASARNRDPIFADVASASFLLTDSTDRSFELFLCGHRDRSGHTICFLLDRSARPPSFRLCASFDASPHAGSGRRTWCRSRSRSIPAHSARPPTAHRGETGG